MTRAEAGPCPGHTDGEHQWLEVTWLGEGAGVERYICGYCDAQAEELTAAGRQRLRGRLGLRT